MKIRSYLLYLIRNTRDLLFSLIGKLRSPFYPPKYYIKSGYFHRNTEIYFDDTKNTDEFQKEVYMTAQQIMINNNLKTVIDVGCGSGFKLMKYLGAFDTTGIEVQDTYQHLTSKYTDRKWLAINNFDPSTLTADLIICADVIEHVKEPDKLLKELSKIRNWSYLLISTPDRDLRRGRRNYGPPPNEYHIREWNQKELNLLLSDHFRLERQYITNYAQGTQLAVCRPKKKFPLC